MNKQIFGGCPYETFGAKGTYLAFAVPKEPKGDKFVAVMVIEGQEHSIYMTHDMLDGFIYALQALKQDLEVLRIKNAG